MYVGRVFLFNRPDVGGKFLFIIFLLKKTPWEAAMAATMTTTTAARGGGVFFSSCATKNAISHFFGASGNKNISATIRIGREIWCLPYAGLFQLEAIISI